MQSLDNNCPDSVYHIGLHPSYLYYRNNMDSACYFRYNTSIMIIH